MTTKTTKTILFSALMLMVMFSISQTNFAWGHHADYLVSMTSVYEKIENLQREITDIRKEINDISDKNSGDSVTKITLLQKELNTKTNDMLELAQEFQRLEQLNMDSYKVDPKTEKKFYNAVDVLYEQYLNTTSPTYIGDNPVSMITVDFQHKNLVVKFDPEQVADPKITYDKTPAKIIANIRLVTDIPIDVGYEKVELIACTNRLGVCDPINGGVQVADTTNILGNGTSGWKSTDTSGNIGFVTARHVSGGFGKTIEQPVNNRNVGTVTFQCLLPTSGPTIGDTCDYAFVDLFNGIGISNTNIFKSSSTSWIITNKVSDANQVVGTTVWKSGIGSSNTMGTITDNNPSKKYTLAQIFVTNMDSGSPIFRQPSVNSNNVDLYGLVYKKGGSLAYYHPWDLVKSGLGLTE